MSMRRIGILLSKDLSLYFRKRVIVYLTFIGLIFYLVIYFVMPSSVDETLKIGIYTQTAIPVISELDEQGLEIAYASSQKQLREEVISGNYTAGVSIPEDVMQPSDPDKKPVMTLYFAPDAPEEIRDAMEFFVKEMIFLQMGQPLPLEVSEEILGQDMLSTPIPTRDRLRPLIAVFILIMEIFGLTYLISEEIEGRTAQALLSTPATSSDIFMAKSISGIGLAFIQAVLIMTIVGGMNRQPFIVLVSLFLGAALTTGVSFFISVKARDFMSVLSWSFPVLIILIIPSFSVIFPGALTGWVKAIPTYYLVDTVHRAANFGSGWGDVWVNLLILFGFTALIFWAGLYVLRRKFQ